jgi:hypothetical protein
VSASADGGRHERLVCALLTGAASPSGVLAEEREPTARAAIAHGLAPMLLRALRLAGVDATLPGWLALTPNARSTAGRYLTLEATAIDVDQILTPAGVPCIWLKGLALANSIYPEPTLRPMSDLDLLVPYDLREEARSALGDAGFAETAPLLAPGIRDLSHHYHLARPSPPRIAVEVHYRLLANADRLVSNDDLNWFWEHTTKVRVGTLAVRTLSPEAHLLHLSAHATLHHGESHHVLRRFLDIHLLISAFPRLDLEAAIAESCRLGWALGLQSALLATSDWFGNETATTWAERVGAAAKQSRVQQAPIRRSALSDWVTQTRDNRHMLRLGSWAKVVLAQIVPSREYVRHRYHSTSPLGMVVSYLTRWQHGTGVVVRELRRNAARSVGGRRGR